MKKHFACLALCLGFLPFLHAQGDAGTFTNVGGIYRIAWRYPFEGLTTTPLSISSFGGPANQNIPVGDPLHGFEIVNDNTPYAGFRMSTYGPAASVGGQNNVHYFRANGTRLNPLPLLNGDLLNSTGWRGWDGASSQSSAAFIAAATENWNGTSHGTSFSWAVTGNGNAVRTSSMTLIGTAANVPNLTLPGGFFGNTYNTNANCSSSAAPAVCSVAPAGSVAIAAAATTVVVNTTAVTSSSQIFVAFDESLGTKLGVTCNSAAASEGATYFVSARVGGTSFTIKTNTAPTTNPACLSYSILN